MLWGIVPRAILVRAFGSELGYIIVKNMKNWLSVGIVVSTLLSCASLQSSQADLQMRYRGTYTCETFSKESDKKESVAEADAARVRCARDSWKVQGDEILFTRTLFQQENCSMELGRITFSSDIQYVSGGIHVTRTGCRMIRSNVSWLGENSGKCTFNLMEVNRPYPLVNIANIKNCPTYIPQFCFVGTKGLTLSAPAKDLAAGNRYPVTSIATQEVVCKRYDPNE